MTTSSNVVPLGYSLKSMARRAESSQQTVLNRLAEHGLPTYTKDGQVRIPRGIFTEHNTRYNTGAAWEETRSFTWADALRFA